MTSFLDDMLEERQKIKEREDLYASEDAAEKAKKDAMTWIPFLNSLTFEKKHMIDGNSNPEKALTEFGKNIFMINKALSMSVETIMYANEMNLRYESTPRMVYDYYFSALKKSRNFAKWPKKNKDKEDKVAAIKFIFNCSTKEAERALPLLSEATLSKIIEMHKNITK